LAKFKKETEEMTERKYSYTELGMLFGIFVGGGLATILYVTTGQVFYFGLIGVGLALGLGLGAAFDGRQPSARKENGEST
jgi:hypothetical protein